jgi:hypothetical protein
MVRWSHSIIFVVMCGLTCLVGSLVPVTPQRGSLRVQDNPEGPATIKEATCIAAAMKLYCLTPTLVAEPQSSALISLEPLNEERLSRLFLHAPDIERWRGIVHLDVRGRTRLEMNYDPARHDCFALWGKLFAYGDPELIARLLSHSH